MFVRLERTEPAARPCHAGEVELLELVSPRTNGANYTPVEHVFAALAGEAGISLEMAGDAAGRRFYARVGDARLRALLEAQLRAAYPQTRARVAASDPARRVPGEQVAASALGLREPEYLPLRVLRD